MGSPSTALSFNPSIFLVFPVTGSPIHSSMPVGVELAKANCFPSSDQHSEPARAFGGSDTGVFTPSASRTRVMEKLDGARCRPLVRGLIRIPASRSIGCDTSAIDGYRSDWDSVA